MKDTHSRIRTVQGTDCSITRISPPACLFPAAILSLLTIAGTSWFLPESGNSALVQFGLVAGTIVITVVAVTAAVITPHPSPD